MDEETLLKKINDFINKNLFQEALDLLLSQEKIVKKKYYDFLKVKIFLFQKTNNLFEAKRLIINELELPYIPLDIEKYLRSSLSEINAIINFESAKINSLEVSELINASEEVIISNLENLKNINLRNYLLEIQFILNRKDLSNLLKSLILALLADQQIDYNFNFSKDDKYFIFNPSKSIDLRKMQSFIDLENMAKKYENKLDVTQYDFLKKLLKMFLLDIYPQIVEKEDYNYIIYGIIQVLNNAYRYEIIPIDKSLDTIKLNKIIKKLNNLINSI